MELLTAKKLNKIRENNKASDLEWEVIKEYLSTGKIYNIDDAKICYENMLNNEKWYQKDFKEALYDKNLPELIKIIIITAIISFLLMTMTLVGGFLYLETAEAAFSVIAMLTIFGPTMPFLLKLNLKLTEVFINHQVDKFIKKLKVNLEKEIIKTKEKPIKQSCELETTKEEIKVKEDAFYLEINRIIKKILSNKYPQYSQDLYDLRMIAENYRDNNLEWTKLDLATKQNLMKKVYAIEVKVDGKIKNLARQEELNHQYESLVVDAIRNDFDANEDVGLSLKRSKKKEN